MAAGSVGNTNLQDGSVSNEKLEDGSITNEKLAENSITKDKLKDNTIGVEKLDPELRQTINAATGLPENLVETIQNVDDTLKDHQRQLDDKQSQIDDKQQQITANDEDISLLQTRSTQMEETIKSIAATGGASQATAVTYNNNASGLNAVNAQAAIDEVSSIGHFAKRGGIVNISTNYNSTNTAEVLTLPQALSKVLGTDRVLGFTMTFLSSDGWKIYQFTGDSISNWSDTTKWDPVLYSSEVLQELGNSKTAPVSQKVVRDVVSKTTKDSRFKETIEVIVPSGTSNAYITIQKYTESGGKLYFTIDNSNFPPNISYVGTQIRDDDNLEITTFGNVTKHTLDSFESKYFNISCYFASEVPSDVHIPIEVVYEQRYKTYDKEISQVRSLVDSALKGKISGVATIESGSSSSAHVKINQTVMAGYRLRFTIDKSNFPQDISYRGAQIRDDNNGEITTNDKSIFEIDSFNTTNIDVAFYFKSELSKSIDIPFTIDILTYTRQIIEDNVDELKFPFLSIKKSLTVSNGTNAHVDYIYHNFYAKGKIRITIDKSNFPLDIPYIGTQIRDDKNAEISTWDANSFEFDSLDSSYLSIGCYFKSDVSKDIVIPYTIEVLLPSPYEEQTRQIIEDISLDGLIPAGISTKRFENFQDFNIYGYGSSVSILKDSSGNYYTPPIEIAGGGISNITVIEDGGFSDNSAAYCVHSDNNNAKGKTLRVDNCHFISNSNSCLGVGTRNGYTMEFRNCVFEKTGGSEYVVCWYSHNTTVEGNIPSLDNKSKVIFIGCTFISDKKYCMRLQDWNGSTTDYCEWTFINCTFICTSDNTDDAVYIEYKNYPDELGAKEFKHKFSLSEKSCGNNVSWLNYNN